MSRFLPFCQQWKYVVGLSLPWPVISQFPLISVWVREISLYLLFDTAGNCVLQIQLHVWQSTACVSTSCSDQLAGLFVEGCYLKQQSCSAVCYIQPLLMLTTASSERKMGTCPVCQKLACPKS